MRISISKVRLAGTKENLGSIEDFKKLTSSTEANKVRTSSKVKSLAAYDPTSFAEDDDIPNYASSITNKGGVNITKINKQAQSSIALTKGSYANMDVSLDYKSDQVHRDGSAAQHQSVLQGIRIPLIAGKKKKRVMRIRRKDRDSQTSMRTDDDGKVVDAASAAGPDASPVEIMAQHLSARTDMAQSIREAEMHGNKPVAEVEPPGAAH